MIYIKHVPYTGPSASIAAGRELKALKPPCCSFYLNIHPLNSVKNPVLKGGIPLVK
jgi:hypothetical protein